MDRIARVTRNDFVIVGRAGMDFYPDPPGTKTEEATQFVACLGGSSANIGVAITRHGGRAALVTSVSDDAIGRFCLNELAKYGVDSRHVRSVGGEARNSLAVVESRVEDHQSVIYRNGAADFQMTTEDVAAVDYEAYGALITTGTVFAAEPSRGAAFHAFDLARKAGLPLIFDIDYRPYSWPSPDVASEVYSRAGRLCDIVIGNDDEFGFMAGGKDKGLAKARELAGSTASIVVYKMGEHGAITITPDEEFRTGIYPVTALKPTGAGDAFMGGFVASLAQGHELRDCVLRGSASAAIVVSRVGCAPAMPTTAELEAFLAGHPGPTDS
ncbi:MULTISPECIES: 5-dehydro-2-deoxygluconokinase [unclassified Aurantimonas]|uniref:5-dehydro-2-deoxygluconokinase n=1 Tax=unclassified Aurantimonas TaxID=2638230 RepID=UPI002E19A514|nr:MULTISPECIES: 5-dehydro-2-deoxygluconokinase [unclassified Aurantimonas]MEC5289508.1 5-dehydro-2-deoxygluconokinase [Aurantimonas sp. C2-3-R2]